MENAVSMNLKKGQHLFQQGASSQGFFCIRKGVVKLGLDTANGESVTVDLYANCGMLGHHSILSPTNFYSATCLTDTEICFIPKSVIQRIQTNKLSMDTKLWAKVGEEYNRLNDVISNLRSKSTLQRTATALLRLHTMFGTDTDGAINLYVTKEELANIIGSSVESVFRTLGRLREKKYIDFEKSKIWIREELKLRTIARLNTQ
jgi:CRP/FNR family transcriptional regulator, anaerobic regulatory protein